jgi:hypothetical protein
LTRLRVAGAAAALFAAVDVRAQPAIPPFPPDPGQALERTCFQTGEPWSGFGNLRSDVAIVYGIDDELSARMASWRDRGYRIHVMTGVSWGEYQDYLYGRFDGTNHLDEAQTVSDGRKSSHGGDVYYMCPTVAFGAFLCAGVQRALDAGTEAIHLEEPEFWVNSGYSEGFQREWQDYYGEPWQAPHSSVDAQWRASNLKYFLYRRALQQVFDHVQAYNRRTGRRVRCYVPTHSLLNYAHWEIVSPESSLAQLDGCDGYIAQVWTGTARTPNLYRGVRRERTFETALLEYGAMHALVRGTGRTVWFLNDPIEDNPNHDWDDYRTNWESTLTASLLHPDVWRFEVAPWPERVFRGRYPRSAPRRERRAIPPTYATELQIVMNTLNDMKQDRVSWDAGTAGIGILISDSLMFQRGNPVPGDQDLSHVYGLALPLLKRGMPIAPAQLEHVTTPGYLDGFRVLLLTYQGMKPLTPAVHDALATWVRDGGALAVCDDDTDPYHAVRAWWNQDGRHYATPRQHLFETLGISAEDPPPPTGNANAPAAPSTWPVGRGHVLWLRQDPATLAASPEGDRPARSLARQAAALANLPWHETNYLLLQRGPYLIAAGLEESLPTNPKSLHGRFINLFDPDLPLQTEVRLTPGSRHLLRNLDAEPTDNPPRVLAAACKTLPAADTNPQSPAWWVEGVPETPAIVLVHSSRKPDAVTLEDEPVTTLTYDPENCLLHIRFTNQAAPRKLSLRFAQPVSS